MHRRAGYFSSATRWLTRTGVRLGVAFALFATPFAVASAAPASGNSGVAGSVSLTKIATGFPRPIGIGYYAPSSRVVLSVNYRKGKPNNFDILENDGSFTPFSKVKGLTDEVYFAAIRSSACQKGFTTGDLYFGTGMPGVIARLSNGGKTLTNPWVRLPRERGLLRGGLSQDLACVAGGDLIVTTTAGNVWRVNAAGTARKLASKLASQTLEGPITVPKNSARYGPWSGQILAGDELTGVMWSIDPTTGKASRSSIRIPLVEAVLVVPPNENFFGVDFGGSALVGAPAVQFEDVVGDVVVATEQTGRLIDVKWNGTSFETTDLLSENASQWEGTTFAPTPLPTTGPVPGESGCIAPLSAPTHVSAAPGNHSATVSWFPAASDPPGCIEEYIVTPHGSGSPVHVLGQGTTTVVPGLTDGTTVTFTVAAANGGGIGPSSAPSNAVTIGAPPA